MTNHPIFDISPSALCRPLRFIGYQDLKSQDLHNLIAGAVTDRILTGRSDQNVLQNFLFEFGFMEFDIDGYNSVLPTCALQNSFTFVEFDIAG